MRILSFISMFVLLISISCTSVSNKKGVIKKLGVVNQDDCALNNITYNYIDHTLSFSFELNENNEVVKSIKKVNNEVERVSSYEYNVDGNLIKGEIFIEDTLVGQLDLIWSSDSVIITPVINFDGYWNNLNTIHIQLNADKEVTRVEDFIEDSLGVKRHYGSGYKATWEQGNMQGLTNWIIKSDSLGGNVEAEGYMTDDAVLLNSRTFVYEDRMFFDNVEIEKFYDATFEYDDKNNPFRTISLAEVVLPSDFNTSVNNPIKVIKTYGSGEIITFNYSYQYNEDDYPIEAIVKVVYNSGDGEEILKEYTVEYNYKNCE